MRKALVFCLLLTGCVTADQIKARLAQDESNSTISDPVVAHGFKPESQEAKLLNTSFAGIDFAKTLHSEYLRNQALKLTNVIMNAALFVGTGWTRDAGKREFAFINYPPFDERIRTAQFRKVRKLAGQLVATNDPEYQLIGKTVQAYSDALYTKAWPEAKAQMAKFQELNRGELIRTITPDDEDATELATISGQVVGEITSLLMQLEDSAASQALSALKLNKTIP
jgi:hypothetical protein